VGDWKPAEIFRQKISTHKCNSLNLKLVLTAKIIDGIKDRVPESFLVAFRAQSNMSKEDLLEDGFKRLCRARTDLVAVNDVGQTGAGFETDTNELYIINAYIGWGVKHCRHCEGMRIGLAQFFFQNIQPGLETQDFSLLSCPVNKEL
jgi:hypothetical protein